MIHGVVAVEDRTVPEEPVDRMDHEVAAEAQVEVEDPVIM